MSVAFRGSPAAMESALRAAAPYRFRVFREFRGEPSGCKWRWSYFPVMLE